MTAGRIPAGCFGRGRVKVIDFKDAKCRHCYKCVRHCMVKAISVENEQAHILHDHCTVSYTHLTLPTICSV